MRNKSAQLLCSGKLKKRVGSCLPRSARLAVMVMSGGFNPVHTEHIRALEVSRRAAEAEGWTVLAGFLAPSTDEYLIGKDGRESLSLEDRIALCRLATRHSRWIGVCPWSEFSSYRACTRVRTTLLAECAEPLQGYSLAGIEVMGSDTAARVLERIVCEWSAVKVPIHSPWYDNRLICAVARRGESGGVEAAQQVSALASRVQEVGIKLLLARPEPGDAQLRAVSSTAIRELLRIRAWNELRKRGWLHPAVLARLQYTSAMD